MTTQAYRTVYQICKPEIESIEVDGRVFDRWRQRKPEVVTMLEELGHEVKVNLSENPEVVWGHDEEGHELRESLGYDAFRTEDMRFIVETPSSSGQQEHRNRRARFEEAVREAGLQIKNTECATIHSSDVCQPILEVK